MALPSSGPLTLADIQTEFGGSNPISLSEYYAGGTYVPAGTSGTYGAVPSSGTISIQNFYGTSNVLIGGGNWLGTLSSATNDMFSSTSAVDSSGNTIVVGLVNGTTSLVVVKYSSTGTIQWQNTYSGFFSTYMGCTVDSSGNIYVATPRYNPSLSDYDCAVIKLNSSGAVQWSQEFSFSGGAIFTSTYNYFPKVVVDSSGNVYVGASFGSKQTIIVKYNSSGTQQASQIIGTSSYDTVIGGMVVDNTNGYLYVSGTSTQPQFGSPRTFLTRLDLSLNFSTSRYFDDGGSINRGYGNNLAIDSSQNLYVLGWMGTGISSKYFIVKFNSSLTFQWNSYTTTSPFVFEPNALGIDSSGNLYVGGLQSGFVMYSLDSAGTTLRWSRSYSPGTSALSMSLSGSSYIFTGPNGSSPNFFMFGKLPSDGTKTGTYTIGSVTFTYANYPYLTTASGSVSANTWSSPGGSGTISYYTPSITATTSTFTSTVIV